jgi:hypothetical protein
MDEKELFLIANADNTEFIGMDAASGGYLYVTDTLRLSLIGDYNYINKYYKDLSPYIKNADDFEIKRIVIEDIPWF